MNLIINGLKLKSKDTYLIFVLGVLLCAFIAFMKEYIFPEKYFFVAPRGLGPKLTDLLNDPEKLKSSLFNAWDTYCKKEITKDEEVSLDGAFLAYYEKFNLPKIIYIHTAVEHSFYYDENGYYINNSCYLISNADKFLSAFLNSKMFKFYKKLNFVDIFFIISFIHFNQFNQSKKYKL